MREYLLVFLVALSVTYLLTVVAREIALRTGAGGHGGGPDGEGPDGDGPRDAVEILDLALETAAKALVVFLDTV